MFPRTIAALIAAWLLAPLAHAQKDTAPKDGKVTIAMTLSPAPVPKPISHAYLVPEYRDLRPGNRVFGLVKSFMEQDAFFAQKPEEQRNKWLEMSLADLPADFRTQAAIHDGLAYAPKFATMLVRVDQAARYSHVDWDEWFDIRKDGIYYLIPEVQKFRQLARLIQLRMRGEVKAGEFDRAIESAKTLFGMAKALEQHPTLIGFLVGAAVASVAAQTLEEMIQQPGCPNLFWSFADLPSPVLNLRHGAAGERLFLTAQFGDLLKADRPWSDAEMDRHIKIIEEMAGMNGNRDDAITHYINRPKVRYVLNSSDTKRVEEGRIAIVARGSPADVVAKFSPLQVALISDVYQFEVLRDDMLKWITLPYPVAVVGMNQSETVLKNEKAIGRSILGPLMIPAVNKVKQAEVRLDQRFAYLRVIEAVRLHAHDHGGKLPATLAEIQLPLPVDPVNGKPFQYSVKDGTATLRGAPSQENNPATHRAYELRVRP